MFHIVLYQPEIPPNTGNIIRLCANTGCQLHLIHPLGFDLNDKQLRRAGLDYKEYANVNEYKSLEKFMATQKVNQLFAVTTKGKQIYTDIQYEKDDTFLFGPETRGLPSEILDTFSSDKKIKIPMQKESRSLNLSNTVSVVVYEAWRQLGFKTPV